MISCLGQTKNVPQLEPFGESSLQGESGYVFLHVRSEQGKAPINTVHSLHCACNAKVISARWESCRCPTGRRAPTLSTTPSTSTSQSLIQRSTWCLAGKSHMHFGFFAASFRIIWSSSYSWSCPARQNGDFGLNSACFPPKMVPQPC